MSYAFKGKLDPFVAVQRGEISVTEESLNPVTLENYVVSASVENAVENYLYRISFYSHINSHWNIQRFEYGKEEFEVAISQHVFKVLPNTGFVKVSIPLNKGETINIGIDTTNIPNIIYDSLRAERPAGLHAINPMYYTTRPDVSSDEIMKYLNRVVPQKPIDIELSTDIAFVCHVDKITNRLNNNFRPISFKQNSTTSPASTLKMLTALVTVEYVEDLYEVITVTEEDLTVGSGYNLKVGDKLTYLDALYNLMMPSSNTSATLLARNVGNKISGTGVESFIKEMNIFYKKYGCENSKAVNPSGNAESGQYTTAYDAALLALEYEKNELLQKIWTAQSYTLIVNRGGVDTKIELKNTSPIGQDISFDGGKTGSLSEVQKIVTMFYAKNNNKYVISLMNCRDRKGDLEKIARYLNTNTIHPTGRMENFVVYPSNPT